MSSLFLIKFKENLGNSLLGQQFHHPWELAL